MTEEKPAPPTPEQLQRHKKVLEAGILAMVKQFEERTGEAVATITSELYMKPEREVEEGEARRFRSVQISVQTLKEFNEVKPK